MLLALLVFGCGSGDGEEDAASEEVTAADEGAPDDAGADDPVAGEAFCEWYAAVDALPPDLTEEEFVAALVEAGVPPSPEVPDDLAEDWAAASQGDEEATVRLLDFCGLE